MGADGRRGHHRGTRRGEGHRTLDRGDVPHVPPQATRRAARRRPRRAPRDGTRLQRRRGAHEGRDARHRRALGALALRRDVVPVAFVGKRPVVMTQGALFEAPALPPGFAYQEAFLSADEERAAIEDIGTLVLREARYKEFTAKRRAASFGAGYDFDANELTPPPDLAPFLEP